MNLRPVLLATAIVTLTACADTPDESLARFPVPSTSPHPQTTSPIDNREQWCEPAEAQWDERLGLTVDFESTPTELTIRYTATNHRPSPVYAINRIQQETNSAPPRERHFVAPRSDGVIEISQRQFRYRSSNCVVPRSMPLPPPLATRLEPGSTLSDTIHVQLPLRVQHPEGASASEHYRPCPGPRTRCRSVWVSRHPLIRPHKRLTEKPCSAECPPVPKPSRAARRSTCVE